MTYTRSPGKYAQTDAQRGHVYHAERVLGQMLEEALTASQITVSGSRLTLPPQATFSSPEAAQAYVDQVLAHPGVVERYGVSAVAVRKRNRGDTRVAHYRLGEIVVPDVPLRETAVLHELAHHFDKGGPVHGPKFANSYLFLVKTVMGPDVGQLMRILYQDGGVKVR